MKMETTEKVELQPGEKFIKMSDVKEGQNFRVLTDCPGIQRTAKQVGTLEILAPITALNGLGGDLHCPDDYFPRSDNRDVVLLANNVNHENPITKRANEIRKAQKRKEDEESSARLAESERIKKHLETEFKAAFSDVLPILEEMGVEWSGGLQDERYCHKGTFIEFRYSGKSCKMDFSNRGSYRYDFVPYRKSLDGYVGKSTFGKWASEGFFIFLDEQLINPITNN